ncbi:MAG: hypothetical protein ACPG47_10165, partial [Leucothrix sp.]
VNGVYLTKHPGKYLGQAALRSPSVFNFYNPDYAPSNTAFTSRSLVGPEMQIQTDQMLLEYSNKVRTTLTSEKNWIKRTQTVNQYANSKGFNNDPLVLISFDEALATYKEALGGNLDNIGKIDTDGVAFRDKAADALINYFDQLLLGETMTDAYKAALKEYLVNANSLRHRDTLYGSMLTIQSTVLMIVTSSAYMIQK